MIKQVCDQCYQEKDISRFEIRKERKNKPRLICKNCRDFNRRVKKFKVSIKNKICLNCKILKYITEFDCSSSSDDGLNDLCKKCKKAYYATEEAKLVRYEKANTRSKKGRRSEPRQHLFYGAKKRAKEKNIEFSILMEDIIVSTHCPILQIPIVVGDKIKHFNSPSLDRINLNIGYIKNNIICVSDKVNRIKNSSSFDEMKLLLNNYFNKSNLNEINNTLYKKKIIKRARRRAQEKNIDFNISIKDIILPEYCPILNIKLRYNNKKYNDYSPSIDRIDNTKGYIKDNIRIISYRANTLKNNSTYEEYKKIFDFYSNLIKERNLNDLAR